MRPVNNYSSSIGTMFFFRAFIRSKTVVLYYFFCGITDCARADKVIEASDMHLSESKETVNESTTQTFCNSSFRLEL